MRDAIPLFIAAVFAASSAAHAAPSDPEARLAKILEGRVAGEPVKCINLHAVRSSEIIENTAIVYDAGGTLYVNRPTSGHSSLDHWDTLVTDTHSPQLCNIDVVRLFDTSVGMQTGVVFLGDFVPYKKVAPARAD